MKVSTFLMFLLVLPCVAQQTPYTPASGSKERKAILDAARPPVEKAIKQKVVFKVQKLRVADGWAYMELQPRQPNGNPINYAKTKFAEDVSVGAFEDQVIALMRKESGKWKIKEYTYGATDYSGEEWAKKYPAAKKLIMP